MTTKLLTGQLIYETTQSEQKSFLPWSWEQLPEGTHEHYNAVAKALNEELGLISDNADAFAPAIREENEDIYVVLYGNKQGTMMKSEPVPTIAALYDTLKETITKDCIYNIAVCDQNGLEIGLGRYRLKQNQYEIISEAGAAQGLNFALYDYAFQNV